MTNPILDNGGIYRITKAKYDDFKPKKGDTIMVVRSFDYGHEHPYVCNGPNCPAYYVRILQPNGKYSRKYHTVFEDWYEYEKVAR